MTRSIRAALIVALVALAVPTAALAARHAAHVRLHPTPLTPPTTSASVAGFDGTNLTLTLTSGATLTGAVSAQTRFICPRIGPRRGAPPPPPCDSSQLVSGEGVVIADMQLTQTGLAFRLLELVPPPPPSVG